MKPMHAIMRKAALLAAMQLAAASALAQGAIEEVQVVARKRQQSAGDVDMSLDVFEPVLLRNLNFQSLPQVAALSENVSLFEDFAGASIPTWVIRGVGLQDFNSNNTPTAAVYLDGAYQVSTVMGAASLFDVADLEILKGPQGGLYGRNTTGGAILLNSRRAMLGEHDASLELNYGNWNSSLIQGAWNQPLGERSAVRVAINAESRGDAWQNSLTEAGTQGDRDKTDVRAWWRFDLRDDMRIEWKVQAGQDNSDIPLGRSLGVYDASGNTDFCAAVLGGRLDETDCINWAGVNQIDLGGVPRERMLDQADDGSLVFSQLLNRQANDYVGTVLELHWDLGGMELLSLSTYDDFGYGVALDLDASAGAYGHRYSSSDISAWSQELRLQGSSDARIQWLAGVSVSGEDFAEFRDFRLEDNRLVSLGRGQLEYDQETETLSAYVDVEFPLAERWALAAGLRWTDEEKTYRNGNFWIPRATPVYLARNLASDYDLESNLAGSLSLQWRPDDSVLGYVKYASGFKSGGFYGGFPFNPAEIAPYREETLDSWEAGLKMQFPDRAMTLELALFHYDLDDVQGFIRDINPQTGTGIDRLANQGEATHEGMEIQWRWQALDRLAVELGLGWLDARFDGGAARTVNLAGDLVEIMGRRPYAPELNGNLLLNYIQPLAGGGELSLDAAYDYRSEFGGFQSSPADAAINNLPGYGLVNLGARYRMVNSPWEFGAWMRNAADKRYVSRIKNDGLNSFLSLYGEPRAYGLALSYRL